MNTRFEIQSQFGSIIEYKRYDSDVVELGVVDWGWIEGYVEFVSVENFEGLSLKIAYRFISEKRADLDNGEGELIRLVAKNMNEYLAKRETCQ